MNQTYRRLYILICNIGIPQQIHMENSMVFLLLFSLCSVCDVLVCPLDLVVMVFVCVFMSKFLSESISFVSQCVRIELKHRQIVVRLKQIYEFADWESVTHTHLRRIKNTHTRSIMHLYTARIQQQMEAVATANQITNIWCDRTRVACQNRI